MVLAPNAPGSSCPFPVCRLLWPPVTGASCTLVFSLPSTFHTHLVLFLASASQHHRPASGPFPSEASSTQTPSAFLTFPCVLALCERSLSHLMRVNHSVITISSLSFTRDQITSPCCSIASFPFLSSLLTISLVQQAASNLIFTIWKTRQHALKSSPPPYLIQIL